MIRGLHAMFYSPEAAEIRAFLRDKLELPFSDVGEGWLIFDAPSADIGCHPSEKSFHEISFCCDDIEGTVAALEKKGVRFSSKITDQGWGLATTFRLPGGSSVMLYEPRYVKAGAKKKAAKKKPATSRKTATKEKATKARKATKATKARKAPAPKRKAARRGGGRARG